MKIYGNVAIALSFDVSTHFIKSSKRDWHRLLEQEGKPVSLPRVLYFVNHVIVCSECVKDIEGACCLRGYL